MIDWQEDLSPLRHRLSCTRLEDIVHRCCTRKSTESQPQCHSTTGREPSFYAKEPGPNAPAQLRPPTDALGRNDECSLSWSRFFQELQVQRSGDAKGGRHKHLHSRAGSNGGKPWSCASQLNRDALLLRRLSMYQLGYEYCLLIIFQRQRPQAQEANDDQRRRLQSHASCGGKPSCYGSEHDPVVHPLLRLTLRYLDRDEQKCPLHSVCFDQCDCQLHVNSKCGDHDERAGTTTEEHQGSTLLPYWNMEHDPHNMVRSVGHPH
ncbi:hypothetical protein HPB51_005416 [Rhipicephalus microplus]|uniref:Uncharacterized protein n=1 Tax=Rhipicephalus microplus TaxID=6941 RepID=A0A9J6EFF6_RHIMP|nr:hypothetical protein HPB51_005416 [Rhipicephalus microplus]